MNAPSTVEWRVTPQGLRPFLGHEQLTAAPLPGSQEAFLACPDEEVLYEGPRGPGKTDGLLLKFYQHVGKGYGNEWRGIIFRRSFPELRDIIEKSLRLFTQLCPGAKYNSSDHVWTFPDKAKLWFAHFEKPEDYWRYHGHAYPFQGWEELCTWPSDECLKRMKSCLRSTVPGIPKQIVSTANPYGVGHNWVKARYRLPLSHGRIIGPLIKDEDGSIRRVIHGELRENIVMLHADPDYVNRLRGAARNEAELKAWIHGDWNIVAGGMFDDVWSEKIHVLPNFPHHLIPSHWKFTRAFDYGNSKPFSVGWWAKSNGEPFKFKGRLIGAVPGDLIRVDEWYGWKRDKPNVGLYMGALNIARGIKDREEEWGILGRVVRGPADRAIFDPYEETKTIAGDMARLGVYWEEADKSNGSRIQGWLQVRKLLEAALATGPREEPSLFVTERCEQFRRTVPTLPRDPDKPDDVDTEAEDHIGDETRYFVRAKVREITTGGF